jgi:ribosome production factor 2
MRLADDAIWKEAMRRAKTTEERPKKNISTAAMGDKVGRIHLGRQDLTNLQTRKMKGLKRSRPTDGSPKLAEENGASGETAKRRRKP